MVQPYTKDVPKAYQFGSASGCRLDACCQGVERVCSVIHSAWNKVCISLRLLDRFMAEPRHYSANVYTSAAKSGRASMTKAVDDELLVTIKANGLPHLPPDPVEFLLRDTTEHLGIMLVRLTLKAL